MKTFFQNRFLTICILIVIPALGQNEKAYDLTWYTIDDGGGLSTGGQYILTGTIGQPDVAYSQEDNYQLYGGFWQSVHICTVNLDDYARFAQYWLYAGFDMPADLYKDNIVDYNDLAEFADEWLYYCPYDWPLR